MWVFDDRSWNKTRTAEVYLWCKHCTSYRHEWVPSDLNLPRGCVWIRSDGGGEIKPHRCVIRTHQGDKCGKVKAKLNPTCCWGERDVEIRNWFRNLKKKNLGRRRYSITYSDRTSTKIYFFTVVVLLYSVCNFSFLPSVRACVCVCVCVRSRQLQVSGFTRSPETIECGTKRETWSHLTLLVASRCNTTTLTSGARPQHHNINTEVSCLGGGRNRRSSEPRATDQTHRGIQTTI